MQLSQIPILFFQNSLISWYEKNKRALPWRKTQNPYPIWLAEIMLQQTRLPQGLPYYKKFLNAYPSLESLATASERSVLQLWQGLGYYTRARNLLRCAQLVLKEHQGKFPTSSKELRKLPGIGPYTAAAIASFAFNERIGVLDGNVYRLLSRFFNEAIPIDTTSGRKHFEQLVNRLVPRDSATYNQAIMEFGALQCRVGKPACEICPLRMHCKAYQQDLVLLRPVKMTKKKIRERYFYYFLFFEGSNLFIRERKKKDIWKGLYEFYHVEPSSSGKGWQFLQDEVVELLKEDSSVNPHSINSKEVHKLTHQKLWVNFIKIRLGDSFSSQKIKTLLKKEGFIQISQQEFHKFPFPILLQQLLQQAAIWGND